MLTSIEATIEEDGVVHLKEPIHLTPSRIWAARCNFSIFLQNGSP